MSQTAPGYPGTRPHYDAFAFQYVYVLRCKDGKLYTGTTKNLHDRLYRHHNGHVPFTKERRPLVLLSYFAFTDKYKALEFEKYLKTGSGKAVLSKRLIQVT